MKNFKCTGSACEDTCCSGGWTIPVDKVSYERYQKDDEIKRNVVRDTAKVTGQYAYMKLSEDKLSCSMLSEDKLCTIQARLGEGALCKTCYIYPRNYNYVNKNLEISATLSCPEIARLALLQKDGIDFDYFEEYPLLREVQVQNSVETYSHDNELKYLWDLRSFSIGLLQNRAYSLKERLILLGMFFESVNKEIEAQNYAAIGQFIDRYTELLDHGLLKNEIDSIKPNIAAQIQVLTQLTEIGVKYITPGNDRYRECVIEFIDGLVHPDHAGDKSILDTYEDAYNHYYVPFMKQHEYILENYLVDLVFKNVFPITDGKSSIFDEYVKLICHYAIIKFLLIGISAHDKGLQIDKVIKVIQSFSKSIGHNKSHVSSIIAKIKEEKNNNLYYMTCLVNH
ncbi:flagellin lysine-N-methylase [Paenibacillus xanthanilyticus]